MERRASFGNVDPDAAVVCVSIFANFLLYYMNLRLFYVNLRCNIIPVVYGSQ